MRLNAGLGVLAISLCASACSSGAVGAAPTVTASATTVTVTATVTSAPPTAAPAPTWPEQVGGGGYAPSPPFPTSLPEWSKDAEWRTSTRAFMDQWESVSGPDYADFPATMNGCNDRRSMVRYRAVNRNVVMDVRTVTTGIPNHDDVKAAAGWLDMDGCTVPQFRLSSATDGSTLTDVAVTVQQWVPAP